MGKTWPLHRIAKFWKTLQWSSLIQWSKWWKGERGWRARGRSWTNNSTSSLCTLVAYVEDPKFNRMILCYKRKQPMCVSLRKLVNSPRCSDPSSSGLSTYNQTDNRKETISEVHHVFRIKLRDRRSLMQHKPLRSSWVRITFLNFYTL